MYVLKLKDVTKDSIKLAGGKGANLGEMLHNNINVPEGFVITSNAYDYFMKNNPHSLVLKDLINKITGAKEINNLADEIKKTILLSSMPGDLRKEILSNYNELGKNIKVAVRSSSTMEDLKEDSFAGQQETYLNVINEEMLIQKVIECYASLWGTRAVMYRNNKGYANNEVSMAVVVQVMIDGEISGVIFSQNPFSISAKEEILVNASFGLGEAVVAGRVTPDSYIVDGKGKELSYTCGSKEIAIVCDKVGTKEIINSAEVRNSKVLNIKMLQNLANNAKKLEQHYGYPVDIEWTIKDGSVYILQVRAVTTKNNLGNSKDRIKKFADKKTIVEGTERCHIPYYPLEFELGMVMPYTKGELLKEFGINTSHLFAMDNQGITTLHKQKISVNRRILILPINLKNLLDLDANRKAGSIIIKECNTKLEKFEKMELRNVEPKKLALLLKELCSIQERISYARFRYFIFPAVIIGKKLNKYLVKIDGELSEYDLLSNLEYKTLTMNKKIDILAEELKKEKKLIDDLKNGKSYKYMKDKYPMQWYKVQEFLGEFGWKTDNLCYPFTGKSWNEQPERFLELLKVSVCAIKQKYESYKYKDILEKLKQEAGNRNKQRLMKQIDYYRLCHQMREDSQYAWEKCFGMARRVLYGIEKVFCNKEFTHDDIMFLQMQELIEMCNEGKVSSKYINLAKDRKKYRREAEELWNEMKLLLVSDYEEAGNMKGIPGSAGIAEGKVCIVNDTNEFKKLHKGDVLVCKYTEPEWTPLFALASAVVSDTGGALSHAAIVAREYGIPAVLGVGNATTVFKDDDIVLVNGNKGEVMLKSCNDAVNIKKL